MTLGEVIHIPHTKIDEARDVNSVFITFHHNVAETINMPAANGELQLTK